jgi:O-antigen/teichoic acid export membrane protein
MDAVRHLKDTTIRGIAWTGSAQFLRIALQLGVTTVLSRLLVPSDFGLVGMVAVFTGAARLFADLGLGAAIVQRQDLVEDHLSSVFWCNVFTGVVICLLMLAGLPLIVAFYGEPRLGMVVAGLSLTFVLASIGSVPRTLFMKTLDMKRISLADLLGLAAGGLAAIGLALAGAGLWSLVVQTLVATLVTALSLLLWSPWKPSLRFRYARIRELLGFGGRLQGALLLNHVGRNLDNLLIGRYLGAANLGYYSLAYQLMLVPVGTVSGIVGQSMFPALSLIQGDRERARRAHLKAIAMIALVTFPMMFWLVPLARTFILLLLGPQWEKTIFLVRILAVVGAVQSIDTTGGWLYQSQGRTRRMLSWMMCSTPVFVAAILFGLRWGIRGVAVCYAAAALLLLYPSVSIPLRFIGLKFRDVARTLAPVAVATLGSALAVYAVHLGLERLHAAPLVLLLLPVTFGTGAYLGLLALLPGDSLGEFSAALARWRGRPSTTGGPDAR